MSYSKQRDEFIATMTKEGLSVDKARALLRYASTLHRLAEAQCNGDWPYNGDRGHQWQSRHFVTCPDCESSGVAKSSMRTSNQHVKVCPDCRTTELVKAALPEGFKAIVNRDPRGAVLKIQVPSGKTDDWRREGICVPTR